ncbi:MAG: hypothetical protein WBD22_13120 [Pyrinomonadaceae bacterium]
MKIRLVAISLVIFVVSCVAAQRAGNTPNKPTIPAATPASDSGTIVPGALDTEDASAVTVPQTAQVDKEFQVSVITSGNGCANKGNTSVVLGEKTADVFIYDSTSANRPGIMCTMIHKTFDHTATIKFPQPGEAVVRIWARKHKADLPMGEPVVIAKTVMIK